MYFGEGDSNSHTEMESFLAEAADRGFTVGVAAGEFVIRLRAMAHTPKGGE